MRKGHDFEKENDFGRKDSSRTLLLVHCEPFGAQFLRKGRMIRRIFGKMTLWVELLFLLFVGPGRVIC